MTTSIPKTQFSIYKVDTEKVISEFLSDSDNKEIKKILEVMLESVKKNRVKFKKFKQIKYEGYDGVVFKTAHAPDWKSLLSQMLEGNELKENTEPSRDFLVNTNVSYILFYIYNDSLYVMTGGYGSFYIGKFVEKNYGLYLLPKILKKENPVVKNIIENNLTGNRSSTHRTNRSNTSFLTEQDLSSIYKQLNVEIDKEIATAIGIKFDKKESQKKKINLVNKDSLLIRRSLSLGDLTNILKNLNALENQKDNFALNYLVLAKKKGIKKTELFNELINNFQNENYKSFILVGDDYENYILNVDNYRIINDNKEIFIDKQTPITISDIFSELASQEIRITHNLMNRLLKTWQIETQDRHGNRELYPQSIINTLQGFIEYGTTKQPCYLINGDWYVFDEVYSSLLNVEYKELLNSKKETSEKLKNKYNLKKKADNEEEYNNALKSGKDIIVTHTVLRDNIEIADAIFWDDTTLYLMHNKAKFDGIGARDLLNQILTAAEYLQKNRSITGSNFLDDYYDEICELYNTKDLSQASKKEFVKKFNNKICFVAGFLKGYKYNSKSVYAKYLNIEANKKLLDKGYAYVPMGIH